MEILSLAELSQQARLMSIPVFLAFVALVVLVSDLIFDREDERRWPAYLTVAGLLGALFLWVQNWLLYQPLGRDTWLFSHLRGLFGIQPMTGETLLFGSMFDPKGYAGLTLLVALIGILVALIVTLMSPNYLERRNLQRGEFYVLILMSTVGLILLAGSVHLILLFLAIELLSIPLYILAAFARPNIRSQESALKYFLLGAFASGFLLYGIALLYGATGTMNLHEIRNLILQETRAGSFTVVMVGQQVNLMLLAGLTMLLIGLGFKISMVPFHQWTPDVYEGAPLPVTAFMISGTKAGAFAALVNVLVAFIGVFPWWSPLIGGFAALTMVVGNIGALVQRNIKRMLAYSSIAHAGYMLIGVAALGAGVMPVLPALVIYLAVYAFMNLGAFAVLVALEEATKREVIELEDFAGLGREHPLLGFLLGFFLLSLAGFPPTAGFFSKFFLFTAGWMGNQGWLILLAVVLSVLSVFYYARYIIAMFMMPGVEEVETAPSLRPSWMVGTAVAVTAVLVLAIGLFPNPLLDLLS